VPGGAVSVRQFVQAGQDQQEAEHDAGQAAQQQELLNGVPPIPRRVGYLAPAGEAWMPEACLR
jgi:hypothetical protein